MLAHSCSAQVGAQSHAWPQVRARADCCVGCTTRPLSMTMHASHCLPCFSCAQDEAVELAKQTYCALQCTTTFSQTTVSGVFVGVAAIDWGQLHACSALELLCQRLANGQTRRAAPSKERAQRYNRDLEAVWQEHKKLSCGAELPPPTPQQGMGRA